MVTYNQSATKRLPFKSTDVQGGFQPISLGDVPGLRKCR
jgi:hypothetical protein